MDKLDPIITAWSGNSPGWKDVKRGVYYLRIVVSWVKDVMENLPGAYALESHDAGQSSLLCLQAATMCEQHLSLYYYS